MKNSEAKTALARKLDIDYTDIANNDLFSAADIQDYLNAGLLKAWDYKPWNFAEAAKTFVLSAGNITNGYVDYPTDVTDGSIHTLRINGVEWEKKEYSSYLKWFEDNPGDDSKYWAEYGRFIFFNAAAAAAGQVVDAYGKKKAPQLSGDNDLLPFSLDSDDYEYSGNNAIVLLGYAEALSSEKMKNPNQAVLEEKKAYGMLEVIWKPFAENRSTEQPKNRPLFNVPDFFQRGGTSDQGEPD